MSDLIEFVLDIGIDIVGFLTENHEKDTKSKKSSKFKVVSLIVILLILISVVTFSAIKLIGENIIFGIMLFILILTISSLFKKILDREI
ncbi:hypothetical protein [Miniphocaeibacter massiliensis]|uniref:hypothetical protein n=1 Tax=Miniphocaeibacter massiliensis TaxID=2041841 RepID=UPI000C1BF276|nr:hypothetical protein [Miniphocaeibacter massiliensis]